MSVCVGPGYPPLVISAVIMAMSFFLATWGVSLVRNPLPRYIALVALALPALVLVPFLTCILARVLSSADIRGAVCFGLAFPTPILPLAALPAALLTRFCVSTIRSRRAPSAAAPPQEIP